MTIVAQRIQQALEANGMRQVDLIRKTGISKGALSSYLSGKYTPKQDNIYLMAQALNVNEAWLMGKDVSMERIPLYARIGESSPEPSNKYTIYLLGRVAAGSPIFAEENIAGELDVPAEWANKDEYYGLKVKGNSMEPKISNGDTVIVHSQGDAESGEIVVATINGDDAVCKRLMRYGETILLRSFNSEYDDIDVTANQDFKIWGKVLEVRHRF